MKQYKGKGGVAVDTAKKPETAAQHEEEDVEAPVSVYGSLALIRCHNGLFRGRIGWF